METFTPPVGPERESSRTRKFAVHTSSYGDQYEQRIASGINADQVMEVTLVWAALTHADADAIEAFMVARAGYEAFLYAVPPDTVERKWICTEFPRTEIDDVASSIRLKLRRVFDL